MPVEYAQRPFERMEHHADALAIDDHDALNSPELPSYHGGSFEIFQAVAHRPEAVACELPIDRDAASD
jgi:hypothetical protein